MKIGVVSDTHIPERAADLPKGLLESFKEVDMIIHAGDLVELSVLEKLRNACANVKAVYGNMDGYEVKQALAEKEIITIGNYKIGVIHGWGTPKKLMDTVHDAFKKDNVNVIVFGHSHSAVNEKKGDILFFNPGSPTDKIFSPYNSYGIIDINNKIEAKLIRL